MVTIKIDGREMTVASATERGRVAWTVREGAIEMVHLNDAPMYYYDDTWQAHPMFMNITNTTTAPRSVAALDSVSHRVLEQAVRHYGIRAALSALEAIAEQCAETSVKNFNTVLAKQWAAWAVELEAVCGSSKLTDPGGE